MQKFRIGRRLRLKCRFTVSDTLTDPTAITFRMVTSAGTTNYTYGSDAELVKEGTGIYYVDWTVATASAHSWWMKGTGTVVAVEVSSDAGLSFEGEALPF